MKRELDLSVYLVTGSDLLPPGKVPLPFSLRRALSDSVFQSYLTSVEEVGCSPLTFTYFTHGIRRLFKAESPSYRSEKRT